MSQILAMQLNMKKNLNFHHCSCLKEVKFEIFGKSMTIIFSSIPLIEYLYSTLFFRQRFLAEESCLQLLLAIGAIRLNGLFPIISISHKSLSIKFYRTPMNVLMLARRVKSSESTNHCLSKPLSEAFCMGAPGLSIQSMVQ